jgi:hypothetical protein
VCCSGEAVFTKILDCEKLAPNFAPSSSLGRRGLTSVITSSVYFDRSISLSFSEASIYGQASSLPFLEHFLFNFFPLFFFCFFF